MLIATKLRECIVTIALFSLSTSSKPEPELLLCAATTTIEDHLPIEMRFDIDLSILDKCKTLCPD